MWRKIKKNFFERLSNKYRLVVMNDETLEERISFRLSRMNVYLLISTILVVLITILMLAIILTPLKELIPGYGDLEFRDDLIVLSSKTDSLEFLVAAQDAYINNLRNIMTGSVGVNDSSSIARTPDTVDYSNIDIDRVSEKDSLLRAEVEERLQYSLTGFNSGENATIETMSFFAPLKGFITAGFEPETEHFGVDIVGPEDASIKAALPGTVILASWTVETGNVIGIQHSNNLVSFYKHNSKLLKKVGNFVSAGDVIAIIGNSGERTTGPHLHFELWQNNSPLNPTDFISFE